MSAKKLFIIIATIYLLGFSAHAFYLRKTVYGDGIYYYSWLRSVLVDHDVNFKDEYQHFGADQPITPLGLVGNKYTVGPALLWAPGFIWVKNVAGGTGYEFVYQFAIGLESVFYCLFGLIILFHLLPTYFSRTAATAATIGIAGATNLAFYGSLDPVNSHAISFFAVSVFLSLLCSKKRQWFIIGVFLGVIGLIRTQDLLMGLLILPFVRLRNLPRLLVGFILAFSPQLLAWQLLYGTFWVSPYVSGSEGFNFLHPHIFGVLFSPQNGLLLWTPIVLLGIIGLVKKSRQLPTRLMLFVFLLELFVVSSWSTWWQGASYGGRMFVSSLPLIAVGLASFFTNNMRRRFKTIITLYAVTIPLTLINYFMMVYFLLIH